eukprot:3938911-Rhodomonas_salina.1
MAYGTERQYGTEPAYERWSGRCPPTSGAPGSYCMILLYHSTICSYCIILPYVPTICSYEYNNSLLCTAVCS